MYRALASGAKSVVTGASLSGTTRSSQRRAGISHKSIIAGIVGFLGLPVEVRYCDLCKARENRRRNPGDYRQIGPGDIWENFQKGLACARFRLGKKICCGEHEGHRYRLGTGIMLAHQAEIESRAAQWPRARARPRCSLCSELMVAPEASVFHSDGDVRYLWSCDSCGQGFVTRAATLLPTGSAR